MVPVWAEFVPIRWRSPARSPCSLGMNLAHLRARCVSFWILVVSLGLAVGVSSCVGAETPEVSGDDPVLVQGRELYIRQCQSCHGAAGGGGRGPKLAEGQILERFPDAESTIAIVSDGRNAMPAFSGRLTADEIEAVVRFTREVLAVAE